jgi:hypothetical protein
VQDKRIKPEYSPEASSGQSGCDFVTIKKEPFLYLYIVTLLAGQLCVCPQAVAQEDSSSAYPSQLPDDHSSSVAASAPTSVDGAKVTDQSKVPTSSQLPPIVPHGRRSIGLVLEGGGALGLAHISACCSGLKKTTSPSTALQGLAWGP